MAEEQKKMLPTLGLTGVTVNAMALIAPGAFLWITFVQQAGYAFPSGMAMGAGECSVAGHRDGADRPGSLPVDYIRPAGGLRVPVGNGDVGRYFRRADAGVRDRNFILGARQALSGQIGRASCRERG